jgi:RNA recognition motif-containing protein
LKIDKTSGESTGQALVEYKDARSVNEAIDRFNGTTYFENAEKEG